MLVAICTHHGNPPHSVGRSANKLELRLEARNLDKSLIVVLVLLNEMCQNTISGMTGEVWKLTLKYCPGISTSSSR